MNENCTVTQAAARLGVSRQRTLKLLATGCLKGTKISPKFWLVDQASVEARMQAKASAGQQWASDDKT